MIDAMVRIDNGFFSSNDTLTSLDADDPLERCVITARKVTLPVR